MMITLNARACGTTHSEEAASFERTPMSSDSVVTVRDPLEMQAEHAVLAKKISELGDWFHNLDLKGVPTAPGHFLGDFPNIKWQHIRDVIPQDLTGATVLDIGCNGGFYSIQMKQRIEFEKCSVYAMDEVTGQFDYVLFMGVFYHLRYPLYALDKIIKKVAGKLIFQTMVRGPEEIMKPAEDYLFSNKQIFEQVNFPAMYFIEQSYSHDYTNWWIPNRSAVEGMLRSSGLTILERPEPETWICVPEKVQRDGKFLIDLELAGTL
jgi:tRNA (mo5U34)-methyltransferase